MPYREILVYPSTGALALRMSDYAVGLAKAFDSRIVGLVLEADVIDFSGIDDALLKRERAAAIDRILDRRREAHARALRACDAFRATAQKHGAVHEAVLRACMPAEVPDILSTTARLYDCPILPCVEEFGGLQVPVVEEVLFGSGRPAIVVPVEGATPARPETVCVAWDGSGPATRAVHDAMPLLQQAALVEVVTISEEKPLDRLPTGSDLVHHLDAHGVRARALQNCASTARRSGSRSCTKPCAPRRACWSWARTDIRG
jgi:hypothetical protein